MQSKKKLGRGASKIWDQGGHNNTSNTVLQKFVMQTTYCILFECRLRYLSCARIPKGNSALGVGRGAGARIRPRLRFRDVSKRDMEA